MLKRIIEMLENKDLTGVYFDDKGNFKCFCYSILPPGIFKDYDLEVTGE